MNKAKLKQLMIDKGERYVLIGAGAFLLLFLILGITDLSGKPSPEAIVAEVESNTSSINNKIASEVDPKSVAPLPSHIVAPPKELPYAKRAKVELSFDPFAPPDKRAVNPSVLALTDGQADFIWAKMIAYDIRETSDGPLLGVIKSSKTRKAGEKEDAQLPGFLKDVKNRYNLKIPPAQRPTQPAPGGPGQPGGNPMQQGRGPTNPNGTPAPKAGSLVNDGERADITYIPFDAEKFDGYRIAYTIDPQRMAIVQAALPYKAQIEQIQQALRLPNPIDVLTYYKDEDIPFYRGVEVQRQTLAPDGKIEEAWSDLDVKTQFINKIHRKKFKYMENDPKTSYVVLLSSSGKNHELVMPLPVLLNGDQYPRIRIPALVETIAHQVALNKPPEAPKPKSQFSGDTSIFDEDSQLSNIASRDQPNLGGPARAVTGREGDKNSTAPVSFQDMPDSKLVRIVDNSIEPGHVYQYRLRVRMQNRTGSARRTRRALLPTNIRKRKSPVLRTPTSSCFRRANGWKSRIA